MDDVWDHSQLMSNDFYDMVRESLLVLDNELRVLWTNRSFYEKFQIIPSETNGKVIYELGNGQWNIPTLKRLLEEIIPQQTFFNNFELKHHFGSLGERVMLISGRKVKNAPGKPQQIFLAIEDITESIIVQNRIKESEAKYHKFIEELNSIIIGLNATGEITFFNQFAEKLFGYDRVEILGKKFIGTIIPCIESSGKSNQNICTDIFKNPKKFYANENEGICKDGSRIFFSWSARATYDETGKISEILIDGNDITELISSRRKIETESSVLKTILEFIPVGLMITDKDHRIQNASKSLGDVLNVPVEKLLHTNEKERLEFLDLYFPDGAKVQPNELPLSKSTITGESYINYETVLKFEGGSKNLFTNSTPIRDKDGKVIGAIGIWQDLTKRKLQEEVHEQQRKELEKSEEALRNEQSRLKAIIDTLPVGLFITDSNGQILDMNPAAYDVWGRPFQKASEISEYKVYVGYYSDTGKQLKPDDWPLSRAAKKGEVIKGEVIDIERFDGTPARIFVNAAPIRDHDGKIFGAVAVNQDITILKHTEQALRESEEKFRAIFEQAAVGMGRVGFHDARWIDVNPAFCRMLGYTVDEFKTTPWPTITHPDDIDLDLIPFKKMAAGELDTYSVEKRFIHKKGYHVWARLTLSLVRDENKNPAYEIAIIEDISVQKQAQEALLESEERFRLLADNISQFAWIADQKGWIFWYNKRWYDFTGTTFDEMHRWGWKKVHHPDYEDRVVRKLQHSWDTGEFWEDTFPLRGKDGKYRWFLSRAVPIRDEHGKVIRWFGTNTDITEFRNLQEQLAAEREKLNAIIDNMGVGVAIGNQNGDILFFNKAALDIHGFKSEEERLSRLSDFAMEFELQYPDGKIINMEDWPAMRAIRGDFVKGLEVKLLRKQSNSVRYLSYTVVPIYNTENELINSVYTITDLTERKTAERALQKERELLQTIIDSIPIMITLYDPQVQQVVFNRAFEQITGWTEQDSKEKPLVELVYPDPVLREDVLEYMQSLTPGFKDIIMTSKNGTQIASSWANIRLPDGRQVGIGIDISERKHNEEALRRSEARLNTIIDVLPVGIIISDAKGKIIRENDAARQIWGTPPFTASWEEYDQWVGWWPETGQRIKAEEWALARVLNNGERVHNELVQNKKFNSEEQRYILNNAVAFRDSEGYIIGGIVALLDITERLAAEKALQRSEERWNLAIENISTGVIIATESEQVIYWNPAARAMHGIKDEKENIEPLEKTPLTFELWTPDGSHLLDLDEWPMRRIKRGEKVYNYELRIRRPDQGWEKFFSYSGSMVKTTNNEQLIFLSVYETTALRKTEQELRNANQELESFSYSVAHDLRNPLRTVRGFADFLYEDCAEILNSECKEYISRIKDGTERMNSIIDDMLALSRISRQEMEISKVDLTKMALASIEELRKSQPERQVEVIIQEGIIAFADARMMSVALGNLLSNAWKYTGKTANPKIEFASYTLDSITVYFVKDNGAGFNMNLSKDLFKPFKRLHSDKEFKGIGVGLAIFDRAIQRHGGKVWAESEPGKGATFYFTISKRPDQDL